MDEVKNLGMHVMMTACILAKILLLPFVYVSALVEKKLKQPEVEK
jgi:hypothetical protein